VARLWVEMCMGPYSLMTDVEIRVQEMSRMRTDARNIVAVSMRCAMKKDEDR
jgi:hypothetical protein